MNIDWIKLWTYLLGIGLAVFWLAVIVIAVTGCTQLDTLSTKEKEWEIHFISTPEGACEAVLTINHDDEIADDSIIINSTGAVTK